MKTLSTNKLQLSFIVIILVAFFSSCITVTKIPISTILDDYKGRTEAEVIRTLGKPDKVSSDGKGGKILDFEKSTEDDPGQPLEVSSSMWSDRKISNTSNTVNYVKLYLDSNGKVYDYKSNFEDFQQTEPAPKKTIVLLLGTAVSILLIVFLL